MQTANRSISTSFSPAGIIWLKLAVLYLMIGVALGIIMGASENFTLRSVHAHINLLGWATMALAGLIYSVFPQAGQSRLAKIHFWLHNIALPVLLVSLTFLMLGNKQVVPLLGGAEIIAAIGIIVFAANIFLNLKKA
ncbi:MAG: hypothetical protein V7642_5249 [Burkholderiales bacterium]|jgi:hypothetical protein